MPPALVSRPPPTEPAPPGRSFEALRAGNEKLPPTTLGIGPPPKPSTAVRRAPPRAGRIWLAIALLLVVGAALGLVIAVAGT